MSVKNLKGLAKAHVVRQDPSGSHAVQIPEPTESLTLVKEEFLEYLSREPEWLG